MEETSLGYLRLSIRFKKDTLKWGSKDVRARQEGRGQRSDISNPNCLVSLEEVIMIQTHTGGRLWGCREKTPSLNQRERGIHQNKLSMLTFTKKLTCKGIFACAQCVCLLPEKDRTEESLELELQTIVSCRVGAGSQTQIPCKSRKCP